MQASYAAILAALAVLGALVATAFVPSPPAAEAPAAAQDGLGAGEPLPAVQEAARIAFGMDAATWREQAAAGAKPDYGTLWIGPWNLRHGWQWPGQALDDLVANDVTPAIHFYYWGDDISKPCLETGCLSRDGATFKDQAGWQALAEGLVALLDGHMQGRPALILLETEFNKGSVATYEPLDGQLEEKAAFLKAGYPEALVVLSFGNWNRPAWTTWDRAAAASDWVGVQALGGNPADPLDGYAGLYPSTLAAVQDLRALFGKPIVIQDLGLSSYGDAEAAQTLGLQRFIAGLDALRAEGVQALLYRSWFDTPTHSTADHFGEAERHWGLAQRGGIHKAAAAIWVDGVAAERLRAQ